MQISHKGYRHLQHITATVELDQSKGQYPTGTDKDFNNKQTLFPFTLIFYILCLFFWVKCKKINRKILLLNGIKKTKTFTLSYGWIEAEATCKSHTIYPVLLGLIYLVSVDRTDRLFFFFISSLPTTISSIFSLSFICDVAPGPSRRIMSGH